ncbi:hypothetical protein BJF89_08695 [Corynebacterium sp. CNJ-954]|uniref:helix-turn-helix domain-containing protein n=1 Tax=Corynebacterium sp. CNJ-954 TaxID=1904962 RepID=UPI000969B444|nr:helix-turn-helix domain-containing protein [Corynebacterium sp. CNJ-954]OLT51178.1 hypothetical protein BJF89_08695 [Corynebacterium sp. CNJ-954]
MTLTVDETAGALGVSEKTVVRRIQDGTLPAYRFGGGGRGYLIRLEDISAALVPVPTAAMFRQVPA